MGLVHRKKKYPGHPCLGCAMEGSALPAHALLKARNVSMGLPGSEQLCSHITLLISSTAQREMGTGGPGSIHGACCLRHLCAHSRNDGLVLMAQPGLMVSGQLQSFWTRLTFPLSIRSQGSSCKTLISPTTALTL